MAKKKKKPTQVLVVGGEEGVSVQNDVEATNDDAKTNNNVDDDDDSEESSGGKETKGQMIQRHKREAKELKKKTQAMMHSFAKNDKKAKKDTLDAIKKLEDELKQKQDQELKDLESAPPSKDEESSEDEEVREKLEDASISQNESQQSKVSRQKRRKAVKVAQEQERERRIAEEKKNTVSKRDIEEKQLMSKLTPKKLDIKLIVPDGNCLYSAVADQLELQGMKTGKDYYKVLRQAAAHYMRNNPDEFMPFIDSEDGNMVSEEKFQEYCDTVSGTTAWGGQLELKALTNALKVPIIVYTAEANSPNIEMGKEFESEGNNPLQITYHRFAYSMGEHYNSVVPLVESDEDDS